MMVVDKRWTRGLFFILIGLLALCIVVPTLFILIAPIVILLFSWVGALYLGGYIAASHLLEKMKIQNLFQRMSVATQGLPNVTKLCSCSYERKGRTYLAIQMATTTKSWSHSSEGDSLVMAVDGLLKKADTGSLLSPKSCESVCANCSYCPKNSKKNGAKELFLVESLIEEFFGHRIAV